MRKKLGRVGIAIMAVLTVCGFLNSNNFAMATVPGMNQRVSLKSTGAQSAYSAGDGFLSADGKMVAFKSSDPNILPTGGPGIYIRNLATGSIARLNVSTAGVVADDTVYTTVEQVSATGRYVIFRSAATNLIDGVTMPGSIQLYLRDTVASTTTLISQTPTGALANNQSQSLGVSSDGRFVAFASNATNLNVDATDGASHLYMLDRSDNSLSVLDRRPDGSVPSGNMTWAPIGAMSCDGSLIAFQYAGSGSGNGLIPGDTSSQVNVYLLDRRGASDKITNLTGNANSAAYAPSISCNGDFIGFKTRATNLDPSISMTFGINTYRPFIYDRVNNSYHLATITTSNTALDYSDVCGAPAATNSCVRISDTGVGIFVVNSSVLAGVSGRQVYLRDVYSGTTELLSQTSGGTPANGDSGSATISADGSMAAYSSLGSNLVSGDTNDTSDVFTSLTGH